MNEQTGCWEWTGWIHPNGYGAMSVGGASKKVRAHRFSWELYFGPIPDEMDVLHKCDVRKCCCPDHLFLGDNSANMRDIVTKGRNTPLAGPVFTDTEAMHIRILYAKGLVVPEKRSPYSFVKLAKIFNADHETIRSIVKGISYL